MELVCQQCKREECLGVLNVILCDKSIDKDGEWNNEYCRGCGDYPTEDLDSDGYCQECLNG